MQEEISPELRQEIGKHFMLPENYGKLDDANCVGVAIDNATNSYVIMYIKRDDKQIIDLKFGTNAATQDVPTLGSILTEMIKGDELDSALVTVSGLEKQVQDAYATAPLPKIDKSKPEGQQVERISTEHQDCANMVLTSFRAAMRHYERKLEGIEEEHFEMNIVKTCPYSLGDCHFVAKVDEQEE